MAKDSMPGWDRQTIPTGPHGWLQWKGTSTCMDVHCICGELTHIDSDFTYYIMCGNCKRVYMANGHVELIELTDDEKSGLTKGNSIKIASV